MLLSESLSLLYYELLPLAEQTLMNISEKAHHKGILLLFYILDIILTTTITAEVWLHYYWGY